LRLLLDQHVDPVVAQRLREKGNDVIAVVERAELIGAEDAAVFDAAFAEHRVVVTYDLEGFRSLARERIIAETHHYGLVLLDPRSFPQDRRYIGRLIAALESALAEMTADDALFDREWWPE
jgi:23S rRNA A2030 N6-methylase RlmJ